MLKTRLGDGIKEVYKVATYSWNHGYSYVATWFSRGGTFAYEDDTSIFFSNNLSSGRLANNHSSRLIIS